jgi:hypothetical protein
MKTPRPITIVLSLSAVVALSVATVNSAPAGGKTPPAKAPAPEAEPEIPQSVFTIPATSGAARDPFFPSRIIQAQSAKPAATNTTTRVASLSCLVLKGLSGTPSNPLAMVNGRTMARGEDAEIVTDCGRLLVHCVDITTNSAIVEVGGERRELRLRSDF